MWSHHHVIICRLVHEWLNPGPNPSEPICITDTPPFLIAENMMSSIFMKAVKKKLILFDGKILEDHQMFTTVNWYNQLMQRTQDDHPMALKSRMKITRQKKINTNYFQNSFKSFTITEDYTVTQWRWCASNFNWGLRDLKLPAENLIWCFWISRQASAVGAYCGGDLEWLVCYHIVLWCHRRCSVAVWQCAIVPVCQCGSVAGVLVCKKRNKK